MQLLIPLLVHASVATTLQTPALLPPQIDWNTTLQHQVNAEGKVKYEAIIKDASSLDGYISWLGGIDLDEWSEDQQLATLINAYNAFTIKVIVEHWPIASIKDISSRKRWTDRRWNLGGTTVSLDDIEHKMIRPVFKQPLIHFSLVCGANGCPPLRSELYLAKNLTEQLQEQGQKTHQSKRWYRYDRATNTIHITKLYKWYKKDFTAHNSSVQQFVAQFDPLVDRAIKTNRTPNIRYLNYDWSLNNLPQPDAPPSE